MKKAELIETVQRELGEDCSRSFAERAVNTVLDSIRSGLTADQSVQLTGFGTFQVRERKARMGLNPQTKQPMQIAASKTVGFRPGNRLKEAL